MSPSTVFDLPPYRMGPYTMRVLPASRQMFYDKRRNVENDWTRGCVLIDKTVSAREGLDLFLRHLVTAIHYRSGLNDRSNEESFTHSLSTGLVELAQWNPQFWPQFQSLLEQELSPGHGWFDLASSRAAHVDPVPLPESIGYKGKRVRLEWLDQQSCDRARVYGYYIARDKVIQPSEGLRGANLAIVGFHEALHFLHHCEGLKDSTADQVFRRTQAKILPRFLKENPEFWRWFLYAANPMTVPLKLAA